MQWFCGEFYKFCAHLCAFCDELHIFAFYHICPDFGGDELQKKAQVCTNLRFIRYILCKDFFA